MAHFCAHVALLVLLLMAAVVRATTYLSTGSSPWPLALTGTSGRGAGSASSALRSLAASSPDMEIFFPRSSRGSRNAGVQELNTEQQVEDAIREKYIVATRTLPYNSHLLHRGINCTGLSSSLHDNHVSPEYQLRPTWLHNSELIGDCPTSYTTRPLSTLHRPSRVLEAMCVCEGSRCSEDGYQCVPVSSRVPVWVLRDERHFVIDLQDVVIACVCARRQSGGGNFVYDPAIDG
ncbi:uncharacterized protein LOC143033034 [Oratosquilla oratoria]|uniref:uncharacterized protein LOC143033034 n=1 Tax=Oratosquilla oratoria TaxID=337810 RepID=UPI003F76DC43